MNLIQVHASLNLGKFGLFHFLSSALGIILIAWGFVVLFFPDHNYSPNFPRCKLNKEKRGEFCSILIDGSKRYKYNFSWPLFIQEVDYFILENDRNWTVKIIFISFFFKIIFSIILFINIFKILHINYMNNNKIIRFLYFFTINRYLDDIY